MATSACQRSSSAVDDEIIAGNPRRALGSLDGWCARRRTPGADPARSNVANAIASSRRGEEHPALLSARLFFRRALEDWPSGSRRPLALRWRNVDQVAPARLASSGPYGHHGKIGTPYRGATDRSSTRGLDVRAVLTTMAIAPRRSRLPLRRDSDQANAPGPPSPIHRRRRHNSSGPARLRGLPASHIPAHSPFNVLRSLLPPMASRRLRAGAARPREASTLTVGTSAVGFEIRLRARSTVSTQPSVKARSGQKTPETVAEPGPVSGSELSVRRGRRQMLGFVGPGVTVGRGGDSNPRYRL